MPWVVSLHPTFSEEIDALERAVRGEILATAELLEEFGPQLGRPHADTLTGSSFKNMKELRITLPDGEWRVAYAFDPDRAAILLVAGSKSGVSQKLFYKRLIRAADGRYTEHLRDLEDKR
jgi:hypothetical protein